MARLRKFMFDHVYFGDAARREQERVIDVVIAPCSTTTCDPRRERAAADGERRRRDPRDRLPRRDDRPLLHPRVRAAHRPARVLGVSRAHPRVDRARARSRPTWSRSSRAHRAAPARRRATWASARSTTSARPSFSVDPVEKLYYCFGCQAGGDIFTFLEEKEGLDFRDAVEQLADRYGVELEFDAGGRDDERRRDARAAARAAGARPPTFYARYLWDSGEAAGARAYLESRGLGREVLEEFGVGYAPERLGPRADERARRPASASRSCRPPGSPRRAARAGSTTASGRGSCSRCATPAAGCWASARARRATTSSRSTSTPPEGPVYRKGRQLFGLDLARAHVAQGRAACSWSRATRTCSPCTRRVFATPSRRWGRRSPRSSSASWRGSRGRSCWPSTPTARARRRCCGRSAPPQAAGVVLKVVRLPDDKDPCDLLLEAGPDSFKTRAGDAIPFLEFQVTSALEGADMSSAADKDKARGGARARVLRRAALGRARRADPPCGGPARPLGAPARAAARTSARRRPGPHHSPRRARRGIARGTLRAGVPRDVRLERRAGARVPGAARGRAPLVRRAAQGPHLDLGALRLTDRRPRPPRRRAHAHA